MNAPTGINTIVEMLRNEHDPERCRKILQMIDEDIKVLRWLRKIAAIRGQVNTHDEVKEG